MYSVLHTHTNTHTYVYIFIYILIISLQYRSAKQLQLAVEEYAMVVNFSLDLTAEQLYDDPLCYCH